jgi:PAS domain S-box-containing protein
MNNPEKNFAVDKLKFLFETKESTHAFFDRLTAFLPSIIYVYDAANKKLTYINSRVTDVLGFDSADITEWDSDLMKLVFKEDVELVKLELDKYHGLKEEENHWYNSRLNDKRGDFKYFKTTGTVLRRGETGKAASILFVAEDISEIHQSRENEEAAKKLMNDTEELLEFGTWSWDATFKATNLSDGMFRLLGYENENDVTDISRNYFSLHISPADQDIIRAKIRKAIEEKSEFEHTCKLLTAAGKKIIVFTKGKIIFKADGEINKIMGITHNITSLSGANNDLLLSKEIINEREKFSGYGSWEYDLHEKEINWSDGMYYIFGYDPNIYRDKLIIDEKFYYNHMPESEREIVKQKRNGIFSDTGKDYILEYEIIGGDKERKIIETYGTIIRDDNNKPIKSIGTTRDVTTIRLYEQELQRKIIELDRSNKDLEEFAYIASHDLQEPLRKVSTFGERLLSKFSDQLGEEGTAYLVRMRAASENMSLLIENLLEFSLLSRKNQPYKECDLNSILKEVQTELELVIEETNTTIISKKLPVLEAIPSQMKQLFNNLISNAIKFRKSQVPPIIEIDCKKLNTTDKDTYGLTSGSDFYKITIEDNGIGFEEEYATKIFQIFQRLHGKAEYGGAGIGLAICKKIADNHHGLIFADSTAGNGATFTIILPEKNIYIL